MAMQYGFFDAVQQANGSYDRVHSAEFFTRLLGAVFYDYIPSGEFKVTAGSGLTLNVGSGHGWVSGVFFYDDEPTVLTASATSGTRNDIVVARLDKTARTITLAIREGSATAAKDEVTIAKITVVGSTIKYVEKVVHTSFIRNIENTAASSSSTGTGNTSGSTSSGGSSSSGGTSGSSPNTSTGTTSGTLTAKVSSTVSSPTVNYSADYTAARSGSAVSVKLNFAAWLNSSGSKLGTGVKLTICARVNGGAWQSAVIKNANVSWSGTGKHSATIVLSAATTAGTAKIDWYVTRSGSTYGGTAGNLANASAPKSHTITLPS